LPQIHRFGRLNKEVMDKNQGISGKNYWYLNGKVATDSQIFGS